MLKDRHTNKVAQAGIGYTVGNFMIKGINFITLPLFSRILSTSDYGIVNTYLAYESIFFIIIGLALHSSLRNANYDYGKKFDEYVSNMALLMALNTLLFIVVGNVFYKPLGNLLDMNRTVLNLMLLNSFGTAMITFYNMKIGLAYKYKKYLLISLLNTLGNVILSVMLIWFVFEQERYYGRILGIAIPVCLISVFIVVGFWRKKAPKVNLKDWKYGLGYSLPIIPHGLSQILLNQVDRIMIKNMVGAAEAGIYSFVYNIYSIFIIISNSLDAVWGPWFYEKMEQDELPTIKKISTWYVCLMGTFLGLLMLISPEVLMVMGARAYWEGKYAMIPVLYGGFFTFLYTLPAQVEYYYKRTSLIAIGTMGAAGISIALNLYFIPRFGYIAAAYTTAFSYILYFIFHYYMAYWIMKKCIFDTVRIMAISIILGMVMAITLVFIEHWQVRYGIVLILIPIAIMMLKKVLELKKIGENIDE